MGDSARTLSTTTHEPEPRPVSATDVYDAHVDFVVRLARGLGVPPAEIADVVQDVFLVVHRKLSAFEGRSTVRTWLGRIVLNVVRTHRRAYSKRRRFCELEHEHLPDTRHKPPDEAVLDREAAALLCSILAAMPEDQRTVFLLAEVEGLQMKEVSEMLSINTNTAYSRLRLAREKYRRAVRRLRTRQGALKGG